jgi:PAS domain S-box-containing protein
MGTKLKFKSHWPGGYGIALVAVAVAFLLREGLTRVAGGSLPTYITFYPAIMLSALLGGVGPGLLATVAAALGVDYFILPPIGSFAIASLADAVGMAFFTGMGVFMSVVAELYRRARQRAAAQEEEVLLREGREAAPRWSRQGLLLNAGMGASLAILAVAGWQSVRHLRAGAEADKLENQTYVVIQELDRLLSALENAETATRGYLLTGKEKYLTPFDGALGQTQTNLAGLRQVTSDNARQQERLAGIEALVQKKSAVMTETIQARRTQGLPAALQMVTTDKGETLMDDIRQRVAQAEDEEGRLLQQRSAAKNADAGKTLQALLASGVLSFLLLITVFLFLKQENARRTKAEADVRHHRDHLQEIVAARTAELRRANDQLKGEIKGHQEAGEALRQSEERLTFALETSRTGAWELDLRGQSAHRSLAHDRIFGYTELLPRWTYEMFLEHVLPEDRAMVEGKVRRAVETGSDWSFECRIRRADQEVRWIWAAGRQRRDAAGVRQGMAGTVQDITERKQAEAAQARLAAIIESSEDAILSKDLKGAITSWNAGADRLFGYRAEEVIGRSIRLLLPAERQEEEDQIMARLQAGERVQHFETVRVAKGGRSLAVSVTVSPLKDGGGRIIGASKIVRDITERKLAEERLRQTAAELARSNRDLEQFAYVASHDLQEPLRAVGGYVKLLEHRFPEKLDAKARGYVAGACEGAARMEQLITDLLDYARVGTRGGAFVPTELDGVLQQALRNLQAGIEFAQATITHDPLPALRVDATQIMQLFQNLIGNALKFHDEQPPRIHIGVQREEDRWVFSVRDNGIGIEPQYYEKIFQIFQRLHTRKDYSGTGIGLAVCKKIVERHGGRIWVESQPGQGSTFYFAIPEAASSG